MPLADDRRSEAAHDAREERRPVGIGRWQVRLDTERGNTSKARLVQQHPEPRANSGPRARRAKRRLDEADRLIDDANGRVGACRAKIEIDRDEQAAPTQIADMVSRDGGRICDVKEQQPPHDGVERFDASPGGDVAVNEIHLSHARLLRAIAGHGNSQETGRFL